MNDNGTDRTKFDGPGQSSPAPLVSKKVRMIIAAVLLTTVGIVFIQQTVTLIQEKAYLEAEIDEARAYLKDRAVQGSDGHRIISARSNIEENQGKIQKMGIIAPESIDVDAFVKELGEQAAQLGIEVAGFKASVEEGNSAMFVEVGARLDRIEVKLTGATYDLDGLWEKRHIRLGPWSYRSDENQKEEDPPEVLEMWELLDEDRQSSTLKIIAFSVPKKPNDCPDENLMQCEEYEYRVWLYWYKNMIRPIRNNYENLCSKLEKQREEKMELCRLGPESDNYRDRFNLINLFNPDNSFVNRPLLDLDIQDTFKRCGGCGDAPPAAYDKEAASKWEVEKTAFCKVVKDKGSEKAVLIFPDCSTMLFGKGDFLKEAYEVIAINKDHLFCKGTFYDPKRPKDTYVVEHEIYDEADKMVSRTMIFREE